MAIKPKLANQFWFSFFKRSLVLSAFIPLLVFGLLIATLVILDVPDDSIMLIGLFVVLGLIISIILNILIVRYITKPLKDVTAAIVSMSDEPTILTPPNPNNPTYEKNGMKDLLRLIYESSNQSIVKKPDKDQIDSTIHGILDSTPCGLIALDHKRQIIYANKAAPIQIAADGTKSIGLLFGEGDNLDNWLDKCTKNAVKDQHIWTRIPDRLPNEEGRRFFDIIASYDKGSQVEVTLSLIDRTASYIVDEEALDFIAFAAHELRGPITVIRGYIDILQDELADYMQGDQIELFKRLVVSANRLSGYIDNILNTSRYDRRHLKVHLSENTTLAVYDVIKDDMTLRASSQNRLLNVSIPDNLPTIAVDIASMSEVLANLIDNAIKYSNEGGMINVTAKASTGFVEISVKDNGIGMPESVVSQLFQKFYRSHRSRESVAGTGIGLYISKAIVESHGGTISVRSQEGHGSIFTVSIPIYSTVADKLKSSNNSNEGIIKAGSGWIKNHSMYRG